MTAWTRDTPWRQGQLVPQEAVSSLLSSLEIGDNNAVVVVASHDCDIAADVALEPTIEVVVGRRVGTAEGNYLHAKHTRKLHLRFGGVSPFFAEFIAKDKKHFSKEAFAGIYPDRTHHLSPPDKRTLESWLADRYRRSAFPNEFERRLKDANLDKAISEGVKPHGQFILKILFDLQEENEISAGVDYNLGITLLYASEPAPRDASGAAEKAKATIEQKFAKKGIGAGIQLNYVDTISDEALSYLQFARLKPWRLDHMSLGADPQQPVG